MVGTNTSSDLFDRWFLDYGNSFHMSPYRGWFNTYESCSRGLVIVSNTSLCEVVGIGSMRLQTVDGRKLTLTRVRYVPALGKKLYFAWDLRLFGAQG